MDLANEQQVNNSSLTSNTDFLQISCNWKICNNRKFQDAFTIAAESSKPEEVGCEDIVSLNKCILLQSIESNNEPCMLDIKLTNHRRISRIAVVSEGYVLEFFKQFGEYETTKFAELVDEFEESSVFLAETAIIPSATEASIKFTKTKRKDSVLWIYGINIYLTEPIYEPKHTSIDIFNHETIEKIMAKLGFIPINVTNDIQSCNNNALNSSKNKSIEGTNEKETAECSSEKTVSDTPEIMTYIDHKFHDMESRLMKRIDEMEKITNRKLDIILNKLET